MNRAISFVPVACLHVAPSAAVALGVYARLRKLDLHDNKSINLKGECARTCNCAGHFAIIHHQRTTKPGCRRRAIAMTAYLVVNISVRVIFRGDAAWTGSRAVACAATSELWRRVGHTGSAFATASIAASIMEPFFTHPPCSLGMR